MCIRDSPAMEAEFGIVLNRDLTPELVNLDYILDSIETIHPIIEIHNLVFNGDPPFGAELLANNAIHAGVVMGKPTKAILAAGARKVLKNNIQDVVSAGIRALYGKQKYAYKYSAV